MNTGYQVYTWVCTGDCDALIVCTFRDKYGWPNGVMEFTCPCGSKCTLLSVEPDTIIPSTTKEGQIMETEKPKKNDLNANRYYSLNVVYLKHFTYFC